MYFFPTPPAGTPAVPDPAVDLATLARSLLTARNLDGIRQFHESGWSDTQIGAFYRVRLGERWRPSQNRAMGAVMVEMAMAKGEIR